MSLPLDMTPKVGQEASYTSTMIPGHPSPPNLHQQTVARSSRCIKAAWLPKVLSTSSFLATVAAAEQQIIPHLNSTSSHSLHKFLLQTVLVTQQPQPFHPHSLKLTRRNRH